MKVDLNNAEWSYILGLLEHKAIYRDYDDFGEMIIPRIAQKIMNECTNNYSVDEHATVICNEMDPEFEFEEAI